MTLKEQIMKLQTYKMYKDEDTVYVERDDVLKALEQTELNPSYNGVKSELEQTRWIPVSERLPEENIHVLCQFYMGGMAECYHAHNYWHIVGGYRIKIDEVVAWMPLPEPYKEDAE